MFDFGKTTEDQTEDILVTQPFSSTVRILLDTLFRYCSDITVCNLSRKTCCPMTDREHAANSTQNTEDMIMIVNKKADEMDSEIAEKFRTLFGEDGEFFASLEEGKDRIVLTGRNKEGHTVETEIFRTENILSDDILGTINYLKNKQQNENVSTERIVTNAIRVRKDQNVLRLAGFTNEELQLLKLFFIEKGDLSE